MAEPQAYDDDFLDEDDFLDPAEVERRLLSEASSDDFEEFGDQDGFDMPGTGPRPFGSSAAASAPAPSAPADDWDAPLDTPDASSPAATDTDFSDYDIGDFTPEMVGSIAGEIDDDIPDQPIPRITIHAFCERPESGALVHNAANDRRLSRAHVDVELGGLPAAIERFSTQSTPDLLIIETGMRGQGLFDQLEELASSCDADTKVIIIGAANDISLYRELMKRGVSEYLVPPMSPLHLIRSISGLYLDPEAPFAGKMIAFIGAKGGVGASTVAHNTSWCISENSQSDCVLMDLDLSFGTAGLDFNQDPAQTLGDALADPERLDEALLDRLLVRCTERLSLFSAPATLDKDWDFGPEAYEIVIDKVRRQAPFITLDLPHTWSPWVKRTILSADQVVVTVTPELASLRNAKNLFDLVHASRPNDEPPKVVVNMAGIAKRPEIPVKDFAEALGVQPSLVLPFEPQLFGKAANDGQMIAEVDPKSKAADGFAHLAAVLSGRIAAPTRKGLFGGLFGK
jgi:pilus assembly protein CpaE